MPSRKTIRLRGISVVVKSQQINLGVYKEVSGKVIVRATRRRMKRKGGVAVHARNTYFSSSLPFDNVSSPVPIEVLSKSKTTHNRRRTVLREFAVGIGVKVNQARGTLSPTPNPAELPINGVRTAVMVTVGGTTKEAVTTKGSVS